MLSSGPAKKVTVSVIEGQKYHGMACYAAVLDYLFFRGISNATVTRAASPASAPITSCTRAAWSSWPTRCRSRSSLSNRPSVWKKCCRS